MPLVRLLHAFVEETALAARVVKGPGDTANRRYVAGDKIARSF
jgi:hypothetical protein